MEEVKPIELREHLYETILSEADTSYKEVIMKYSIKNKSKDLQTASPTKYPQGYFKDKACRHCGELFSPNAPSEHYCSDSCKDYGVTNAYLSRTYNITLATYTKMFKEQNGLCKICNKEGFTMKKSHKVKLVVDHCHSSNKVRGLLCHNCNRALGLLKDDIDTLTRAIDYLK